MKLVSHIGPRIPLLTVFLILFLAPMANANMVAYPPLPLPVALICLVAEGLFVGAILIPLGFRFVRMLFTWTAITTLTWICLIAAIVILDPVVSGPQLGLTMIVAGESIVIVGEAYILRYLSAKAFFQKDARPPLGIALALGLSLLANLISLGLGVVLIFPS